VAFVAAIRLESPPAIEVETLDAKLRIGRKDRPWID
jgi:hypothetical protein